MISPKDPFIISAEEARFYTDSLLTSVQIPDSLPYSVHLVDAADERSRLATRLTAQIFGKTFDNQPGQMHIEYEQYLPRMRHFLVLDRRSGLAAGSLSVICGPLRTLKSIEDMQKAPWRLSLELLLKEMDLSSPEEQCWDIATLAVLPRYRSTIVAPTLMHSLYVMSRACEISKWVTILDLGFLQPLRMLTGNTFLEFSGAAPAPYLGSPLSVPLWARVPLRDEMEAGRVGALNIVTSGRPLDQGCHFDRSITEARTEHAVMLPSNATSVLDAFDPDFLEDPAPHYARARCIGAVARSNLGPAFLAYSDVHRLLRDSRFRQEGKDMLLMQGIEGGSVYDWWSRSLITSEGPSHSRLRRVLVRHFSPTAAERLRPEIAKVIQETLERFVHHGKGDLAEQLCAPFAARIMCLILGCDAANAPNLIRACRDIGPVVGFQVAEREESIYGALIDMQRLISRLIDDGANSLKPGVLRSLVRNANLSRDEVIDLAIVVAFSGQEALRMQLGSAIELLALHPQQWAKLRAEPRLTESAVEEVLRMAPVFPAAARVLQADHFVIAGEMLHRDAMVFAVSGAANRDPSVYEQPDSFLIDRKWEVPPLSFGAGPHYCLGASLARVALTEALRAISLRFESLCLAAAPRKRTMIEGQVGPEVLPISYSVV